MIAGIFPKDGSSEIGSSSVLEGAGGRVSTKESREGSPGGGAGQPGRKAPGGAGLQRELKEDERTLGFTDSRETLSGEVRSLLANGCASGFSTTLFFFFFPF